MVHNVKQRGKASVVIEAAFGMSPEPVERGSAVSLIWGPIRLEIIDADFCRLMQVPSWLGKNWLSVAGAAFCFAIK